MPGPNSQPRDTFDKRQLQWKAKINAFFWWWSALSIIVTLVSQTTNLHCPVVFPLWRSYLSTSSTPKLLLPKRGSFVPSYLLSFLLTNIYPVPKSVHWLYQVQQTQGWMRSLFPWNLTMWNLYMHKSVPSKVFLLSAFNTNAVHHEGPAMVSLKLSLEKTAYHSLNPQTAFTVT